MSLAANSIDEKKISQFYEQVHRHVIMDEIIDIRTNGNRVSKDDSFVTLRSGAK